MKILESSENYLETILLLQKKNGSVRAVDISKELSFSKASVSVAMKQFRENDYIKVADNGNITLLPKGMAIAEATYEKHIILSEFLMKIGVEEEIAKADACKIEHGISSKTVKAIKEHMESF